MKIVSLFDTTDEKLVDHGMALLGCFMREELAPLNARQAQAFPQDPNLNPDMVEAISMMVQQVTEKVEYLIAERLTTNNREVPLLREADVRLIMRRLFEGEQMDDDLMGLMEMARPYVTADIALNVCFFSAVDEDLYKGFWRLVGAIYSAAAEAGLTPVQAVASLEVRNAVYRSCMTPESWQTLSKARLSISSGFVPSKLLAGIADMLDDADALELERNFSDTDAEYVTGPKRTQLRLARTFYAERARQIWPVTA